MFVHKEILLLIHLDNNFSTIKINTDYENTEFRISRTEPNLSVNALTSLNVFPLTTFSNLS